MSVERLEVAASGLSLVMSTFPVLIGQKEEKESNPKKKDEEETHICLKFVSPAQRHRGEDTAILGRRTVLYEKAKKLNPERWSGSTRDWIPEKTVHLNPNKSKQGEEKNMAIAA
jgi:hypothetical protein